MVAPAAPVEMVPSVVDANTFWPTVAVVLVAAQKSPRLCRTTGRPVGTSMVDSASQMVMTPCCSRCTKPVGLFAPALVTSPAASAQAKRPTVTPVAPATS
ncbi:hypothetical protein G6F50_017635 [Rhizopus delemar]|uniref:Uncharacterized protein n=1 Tax=Rhizopus delemar TaxID=936053 RepID=A0A9P7C008_9FUNG|nr:hypothetical protein G6F50_017635 [Rhizopus delemar]